MTRNQEQQTHSTEQQGKKIDVQHIRKKNESRLNGENAAATAAVIKQAFESNPLPHTKAKLLFQTNNSIITTESSAYYKERGLVKEKPFVPAFDQRNEQKRVEGIFLKNHKGEIGKNEKKMISATVTYLENIQGKLAQNGRPKSENEFIYMLISSKALKIIGNPDIKENSLKAELGNIVKDVSKGINEEVGGLKDSLSPLDPTLYITGLVNFALSIGFELIPSSNEKLDFGLNEQTNEKGHGLMGTVALGTLAGTILVLYKKGKIKEATEKLKEFARLSGAKLQKLGTGVNEGGTTRINDIPVKSSKKAKRLTRSEKISKAEARSGISKDVVETNAKLGNDARIAKAEEILKGKGLLAKDEHLSEVQKSEILANHFAIKGEVYGFDSTGILQKTRKGKEAANRAMNRGKEGKGLEREGRRALMESGIMGSIDSAIHRAEYLPALRKIKDASPIANTLESMLSPYSISASVKGLRGGKIADAVIDGPLKMLKKTEMLVQNKQLDPETYKLIRMDVHNTIETELKSFMDNTLDYASIADLNPKECLEKLSEHGVHFQKFEKIGKQASTTILFNDILKRVELSRNGLNMGENARKIAAEIIADRKQLTAQLLGKEITKDSLEAIKAGLNNHAAGIKERISELKIILGDLSILKEVSKQEMDAKKLIEDCISALQKEEASLIGLGKGYEIATAKRTIEAAERLTAEKIKSDAAKAAEQIKAEAKIAAEKLAAEKSVKTENIVSAAPIKREMTTAEIEINERFGKMTKDERINYILTEKDDLNLNGENFQKIHRAIQANIEMRGIAYPEEALARLGLQIDGNLSPLAKERQVWINGTWALNHY